MSRIELNFVATGDFKSVQGQINALRTTVQQLNKEMVGVGIDSGRVSQIRSAVAEYDRIVQSTGQFTRQMVQLDDATVKFGRNLQDNKLKLNDYFKAVREGSRAAQGDMRALAEQQVRLNNSVMRTDPFNSGKVMVDTPRQIDTIAKATEIARTQQGLYNLALKNGAGELINWGKNTQWAGRQLTVGLTVPITLFGKAASDVFMKFDKELTRMSKVYGSGLTSATKQTTDAIRAQVTTLAVDLAKTLGQSVDQTAAVAADVAATGMQGQDLLNATLQTSRLATLGEIDRQEAMRATVSLQNVFKLSTNDLTDSINFLNAVENQTSTSLQDIVTAIPKAAPVIKQLGGSYKDLAAMMVAMREAGVPAAESANAIKSALGSVINPSKKTSEELDKVGVNLRGIVDTTQGDPVKTFMLLGRELDNLSSLERARAIETVFGKFQFSRISALLANLGKEGSQTQQVFKLMGASAVETAALADAELKAQAESISGKYQRALVSLQASLLPFGQKFTEFMTKFLEVFTKVSEFISGNEGLKNFISILAGVTAFIGPVIMLAGVFGNFFGYMFKGIATIKNLANGFKGFGSVATAETFAASHAVEMFTEKMVGEAGAVDTVTLALTRLNEQLLALTSNSAKSSTALVTGTAGPSMAQSQINASLAGYGAFSTYKNSDFGGAEKMHIKSYGVGEEDLRKQASAGILLGGAGASDVKTLQKELGKAHNMAESIIRSEEELVSKRIEMFTKQMMEAGKTLPEIQSYLSKSNINETLQQLYLSKETFAQGAGQYVTSLSIFAKQKGAEAEQVKTVMSQVAAGLRSGKITSVQAAERVRQLAITLVGSEEKFVLELESIMAQVSSAADPTVAIARLEQLAKSKLGTTFGGSERATGKGHAGGDVVLSGMYGLTELESSTKELSSAEKAMAAQLKKTQKAANINYSLHQDAEGLWYAAKKGETKRLEKVGAKTQAEIDILNKLILEEKKLLESVKVRTKQELSAAETAALVARTNTQEAAAGASGKKGGAGLLGKIGGGMGLAIGGGMLANYAQGALSPEQQRGGVGKAVGLAGTTAEFAGMGMMFGPYGAAAGATIGVIKGLIDITSELVRVNENKLKGSFQVGAVAAQEFGIQIYDLANVQIAKLTESSVGATDAVTRMSEAYGAATDQQTIDFINSIKDADPEEAITLLVNKFKSNLVTGMGAEKAKIDIASIIKTTGRSDLVFKLKFELDKYSGMTPAEALKSQLSTETTNILESSPQYKEYQNFLKNPQEYLSAKGIEPVMGPVGGSLSSSTGETYASTLNDLKTNLEVLAPQFDILSTSILNSMNTVPIENFVSSLGGIFDETTQGLPATELQFDSLVRKIGEASPEMATAMGELKAQGVSYSRILEAVGLNIRGLTVGYEDLKKSATDPVYMNIIITEEVRRTAIDAAVAASGGERTTPTDIPSSSKTGGASSKKDNRAADLRAQWAQEDRRAAEDKAIEDRYSKLTKIQQDIIDKINKEREARKKLADQQKENETFLLNEMSLKQKMTEALATGDFLGYYQSQLELAQAQEQKAQDDKEKRLQAAEDRKIKIAENSIKSIDKSKKAAIEALQEIRKQEDRNKQMADAVAAAADAATAAADGTTKSVEKTGKTSTEIFAEMFDYINHPPVGAGPDSMDRHLKSLQDQLLATGATAEEVAAGVASIFKSPADTINATVVVDKVVVPQGEFTYASGGAGWIASGQSQTIVVSRPQTGGPTKAASGGYISGPGGPREDLVPAMLSNGEYVIQSNAVDHYGKGFLDSVNHRKYANGGIVSLRTGGDTGGGPVDDSGTALMRWASQFVGKVGYDNQGNYTDNWADAFARGLGCSNFTGLVLKQAGINLPQYSPDQIGRGDAVAKSSLTPGDLLFWRTRTSRADLTRPAGVPNHVAFYAGSGRILGSQGGSGVSYRDFSPGSYYWSDASSNGGYGFLQARRVLGASNGFRSGPTITGSGDTGAGSQNTSTPVSSAQATGMSLGKLTFKDGGMIPQYETGGAVQYSKGGEVMAYVHGGEVVVPTKTVDKVNPLLDALTSGKMGLGAVTNNIAINGSNHSPQVIAQMVVGEIEKSMKRTISVSRVI